MDLKWVKRLLFWFLIIGLVFIGREISAESSLRVVWGAVDYQGTILSGNGFSVTNLGCSGSVCRKNINFTNPFVDPPTCTVTPIPQSIYDVVIIRKIEAIENYYIRVFYSTSTADQIESGFTFICME